MLPTLPILEPPKIEPITLIVKQEQPKEQYYVIQTGDTLTSIAQAHSASVERLWRANSQISHPDILNVNETIKIPSDDEVLPERPMPSTIQGESFQTRTSSNRGSSIGNTYYKGQCVWYIKNIVSWVQNGWGNANQWKYRSGHRVSSVPVVGSVATARSYSHVALVTGIAGSSVQITEMNYRGWNIVSSRQAPISEFEYIYP